VESATNGEVQAADIHPATRNDSEPRKVSAASWSPPWQANDLLPEKPEKGDYGLAVSDLNVACSQADLIETVRDDVKGDIRMVWTPATPRLALTEEVDFLTDAVKACRWRRFMEQRSAILGMLYFGVFFFCASLYGSCSRNILVSAYWVATGIAYAILVIMMSLAFLYERRYAPPLTPERLAQLASEHRYQYWLVSQRPLFSAVFGGCFVLVPAMLELAFRYQTSAVWWFRVPEILGFGCLLEVHTRRAWVPVVFALCGTCGMACGLGGLQVAFVSGGVAGLIGALAAFCWRHRACFPLKFLTLPAIGVFFCARLHGFEPRAFNLVAETVGFVSGVGLGLRHLNDATPLQARVFRFIGIVEQHIERLLAPVKRMCDK
jgi:DNA polymerase III psi subunit